MKMCRTLDEQADPDHAGTEPADHPEIYVIVTLHCPGRGSRCPVSRPWPAAGKRAASNILAASGEAAKP